MILVRADSAFFAAKLVNAVRNAKAHFSITVGNTTTIRAAIEHIPGATLRRTLTNIPARIAASARRTGLRALLAGHGDLALIATYTSIPEFERLAPTAAADVVLLDLMLEDGSTPAENVAALRAQDVRVLILSVHGERRHIRATLRAGASGYLVKDDDADKLADALRTVHADRLALTTDLMSLITDDPPALSDQEHQALYLYGTGSTLAATARRMGVSISTVRSYLERIRAKWATADEPVEDIRTLIDEYQARPVRRVPPQ
jgi:DNA-binding NarL/FixJ family response regulator